MSNTDVTSITTIYITPSYHKWHMLNVHRLASQTMCVWGRITNGHVRAACAQFSHVLAAMASQRTNRSLTKSDISCMELKLASLASANNYLRLEGCGVKGRQQSGDSGDSPKKR